LIRTAQIAGVPVLLYAHGTGLATFRATLSPRWQRAFDRLISRSAGVIVLAECLREDFAGLLPADRIHVAWPGVEPQAELPARRPHADLRVVYLGALIPAKGVLDLIRAFPMVRERQPTATLTLAGDWVAAAVAREAQEFIQAQGVERAVTFAGRVSGLAKWELLCDADVFVVPVHSAKESFGLVMLEAMQAGLPIVATRGGARSEVLVEGVNALFAAEQNPADLADAIARLLADAPLRERMGRANRERFLQMFTHEQYGQRMVEVFARCSSR
jgi:glycosyltransferase involved in cell wall biosynthesis